MSHGKLQVLLVSAKGLDGADFLYPAFKIDNKMSANVDPYAVITCRSQEQKSNVASGGGSNPEWNETFVFTISGSVSELVIKLFDKDTFTADDFLGETKIPLEPVFLEGNLPVASYNVVKDEEYRGEVKLSLSFSPERSHSYQLPNEEVGGWKQSSYN